MGVYAFIALCVAGILAAAVIVLDRPRVVQVPTASLNARRDLGELGFAELFTRAYLTYDSQSPQARERALAPYVGGPLDADAGFQPPDHGAQHVWWAQVWQQRAGSGGETVYTVAAQTDQTGLSCVSVPIRRSGGALEIFALPAIVGCPRIQAPAQDTDQGLVDVSDPDLQTIARRALTNYLASNKSDLQADVDPAAQISLPSQVLALSDVVSLKWTPSGGGVLATVRAADAAHGGTYTLRYQLDLVHRDRWYVAAIQMDPTT